MVVPCPKRDEFRRMVNEYDADMCSLGVDDVKGRMELNMALLIQAESMVVAEKETHGEVKSKSRKGATSPTSEDVNGAPPPESACSWVYKLQNTDGADLGDSEEPSTAGIV